MCLHGELNLRELADVLRRVERVLHKLANCGVQRLARLRGAAHESVELSEAGGCREQERRTLSKPAMFLLSAKNCAGDLDCRFLSPCDPAPALGGAISGPPPAPLAPHVAGLLLPPALLPPLPPVPPPPRAVKLKAQPTASTW